MSATVHRFRSQHCLYTWNDASQHPEFVHVRSVTLIGHVELFKPELYNEFQTALSDVNILL
jgi:hypothetical protein